MSRDLASDNPKSESRGLAESSAEPRFLVIGQIRKAHGIRGEVSVTPYTDLPERFSWLERVFVGKSNPASIAVESARFHNNSIILKLAGIDDRDVAGTLRGEWLQVPEEEAIPLEEGEYFLYQLHGLTVVTDVGETLGILVDVIETGANNVFVVSGERGEILLPDTDEVILNIDFQDGRITVHLLPGLLPE